MVIPIRIAGSPKITASNNNGMVWTGPIIETTITTLRLKIGGLQCEKDCCGQGSGSDKFHQNYELH